MGENVPAEGWKLLVEEAEAVGLGEKTGILEKGRGADLIVIDGDPLKYIAILYDKRRIKLIIKGGG